MIDTESLDYTRGIIGKLCYLERLSIVCRAADTAVVQQDEFVGRCESISERWAPVCTRHTEAIQDHKRRTFPDDATNNLSAINRGCCK